MDGRDHGVLLSGSRSTGHQQIFVEELDIIDGVFVFAAAAGSEGEEQIELRETSCIRRKLLASFRYSSLSASKLGLL